MRSRRLFGVWVETHVAIELSQSGRRSGLWHRISELASALFDVGAPRATARIEPRLKTNAKATEDALVALILDNLDAAVTVYDANGNLIRANHGAERMSGYTFAELQHPENLALLIPAEERGRVETIITNRSLSDFPIANVNSWVHKDGTRRVLRWSNVALPDAEGGIAMIVCIGFDITDQHTLEQTLRNAKNEAEMASRAKSEFLANMSHELRTPLNAILGFSQVIRDRQFGDALTRYSEYAGNIHDSGEMLLALISDILEMAKLEAGKLKLSEESVDLNQAVESCLKMVSTRAQDGKVQLVTEMPEQQIVRADQRAVKQILLNLLSNAVKFTPAGGKVSVAVATEPGADIRLTVADTGIGIHKSALAKVFQPFYQVDHTATRSKGGTGLGLAIVKHLVDLHGGSIGLDSTPGRGTTVTVTLPAQRLVLL